MMEVVQTHIIPTDDLIDDDVLKAMNSLGCFKDKEKLKQELLQPLHNTEKVIYFLLLDRKKRKPSHEDDTEVIVRNRCGSQDPPKKRIDSYNKNGISYTELSQGSPITPRRKLYNTMCYSPSPRRKDIDPFASLRSPANNRRRQLSGSSMISQFGGGSNNNSQAGSTCGSESPLPSPRFTRYIRTPQTSDTNNTGGVNSENSRPCSATSSSTYSPRLGKICSQPPSVHIDSSESAATTPGSPSMAHWKNRLSTIKNNFLGSPRFHRRKLQSEAAEELIQTPEASPELTKRSWFGSLMSTDRDETYTIIVKEKPLASIKADLVQAFLSITDLQHSVLSPLSFRLDYKRGTTTTPTMFQRQVRMQVNISDITDTVDSEGLDAGGDRPARAGSNGDRGSHHGGPAIPVHAIMFTLLSGNLRRFRRICEHTQSVVSVVRRQPLPPASPRAARRNSTNKSDGGSDSRPQPPSRSTDGAGGRTTGKNEVSDSSSCNSDVSHGIEPNSKNGPSSNVLTVPSGSSTLGTSAVEATATSVTSTAHHENKASPSVATQKINIVVGNGTSPTSATASLSGTSQNSLNSESGGGGRGSPRLKMEIPSFSKKETALNSAADMISGGGSNVLQPSGGLSESNPTASAASKMEAAGAPIATMEGHDDADLKLDGGDVTKAGKGVTSPPSCTRLDEASQACV